MEIKAAWNALRHKSRSIKSRGKRQRERGAKQRSRHRWLFACAVAGAAEGVADGREFGCCELGGGGKVAAARTVDADERAHEDSEALDDRHA